ncbi:T9SS type A sorting domain-containing protein, partial [candidate division WOR-3 bacterium]|nr:T9SS type A sorting domain-containing protein [candidate division WOR-3 bacterium]MBD3364287.1 T9SS type A sorting domain-containing protein [candidate division WOR-3 bacterium]
SLGVPVRFSRLEGAEAVTVYTVSGEKIDEIYAEDFVTIQDEVQAELDVTHLASGLYIASVRFSNQIELVKFAVVR